MRVQFINAVTRPPDVTASIARISPKRKKTIRLIIHCHLSKLQAVTIHQIEFYQNQIISEWCKFCKLCKWVEQVTTRPVAAMATLSRPLETKSNEKNRKKELPARGVDPHNSRSINRTGGTATRRAVDRNSSEYISFLCVCFSTSPPRKMNF